MRRLLPVLLIAAAVILLVLALGPGSPLEAAVAPNVRHDVAPGMAEPLRAAHAPVGPTLVGRRHAALAEVAEVPEAAPQAEAALAGSVDVVDAETGRILRSETFRAERGKPIDLGELEDVPDGYVSWDVASWDVPIARRATSLRVVRPLRREAVVTASIVPEDGSPASVAVTNFVVAGRTVAVSTPTYDVARRQRIRGVPFFGGETVEVTATGESIGTADPPFRPWGEASFVLPEDSAIALDVQVSTLLCQEFEGPTSNGLIGTGGGCGCAFRGRGVVRDVEAGNAEIVVRRRDGTPAAGAEVVVGSLGKKTADAAGRIVLSNVRAGDYRMSWKEPGVVPGDGRFTVEAGATTRVTLGEPKGATIRLVVVDEKGRPLPFADVRIEQPSAVPWVDVSDDGVQRVDGWTDAQGSRRLDHVEPGKVVVGATWASHQSQIEVELVEGEATDVRLVLH